MTMTISDEFALTPSRLREILTLFDEAMKMGSNRQRLAADTPDEVRAQAEAFERQAARLMEINDRPFSRVASHCAGDLRAAAYRLRRQEMVIADVCLEHVEFVSRFVILVWPPLLLLRLRLFGLMARDADRGNAVTSAVARNVLTVRQLAQGLDSDDRLINARIIGPVSVHLTRALGFVLEGDIWSAHSALNEAMA